MCFDILVVFFVIFGVHYLIFVLIRLVDSGPDVSEIRKADCYALFYGDGMVLTIFTEQGAANAVRCLVRRRPHRCLQGNKLLWTHDRARLSWLWERGV